MVHMSIVYYSGGYKPKQLKIARTGRWVIFRAFHVLEFYVGRMGIP